MRRLAVFCCLVLALPAWAKTPKPLVTIELERRAFAWPDAQACAWPAEVAHAVAELAAARDSRLALEQRLTADSRAQEVGESPTVLLEKAVAAERAKRKEALARVRPVAKSAPQLLLLATLESDQADDAYTQAVEQEAKAPKRVLAAVETLCAQAIALAPDAATARQLHYLWALALDARGRNPDAATHLQAALGGADEPWRSELAYRLGAALLAKDAAAAQAAWAQAAATPFVTYAGFRAVMAFAQAGRCEEAGDALGRLRAAPPLAGTSFVEVAAATAAACKPKQ